MIFVIQKLFSTKPEHYPLVMPVVVHIEGAIIPGPTHKVSQARVHRDVVVADKFIDVLIRDEFSFKLWSDNKDPTS